MAGRPTHTFDQSGNRTGAQKPDGSRTTTTYDFENRDVLVVLPTGVRNTMAYDPDGLRVLLQDSSGTTKFVYDNQQYLLQTDGSNVVVAIQTQEPGTYSDLISQYQFDGSPWLPSYHHYDSLGNTSELTDANEEVTDTYDYNAWGELVASTGTTVNPFQYRGRWGYFTNPDTGEVYVLMRTYDPVTGRWTTLDLLRFVDGLNMYLAYFVPNSVDPSGGQNEVKTYNWEWAWRHLGSPGSLSFFEKGCVGVTSCMIGENLWQEGFKSCYPTYKQAESKQVNFVRENPKCCPQIYAFTWLEYVDRWKDGKAPWEIGDDESITIYPRPEYFPPVHSLFDYQYFDSSEDGGGTSSKGSGGKAVFIPRDMIDEYNPGQNPLDPPKNAKRNKFRVYCTTCKGNEKLK